MDPSGRTAVILIGASDHPHGVIEFSESNQPIRALESEKEVDIRFVRLFGKLGKLEVRYQLEHVRNSSYRSASIIDDIGVTSSIVTMEEGQDTIKIAIPLIDDNFPEP